MLEVQNRYYQNADEYGTPESKVEDLLRELSANPALIGYQSISIGLDTIGSKFSYLDFYLETENGELAIGEIKNNPPTNEQMKQEYLSQLKRFVSATNAAKAILVIPSYVSSETRDYFENNKEIEVEIWDIEKIYQLSKIKTNS